MLVNRSSFIFLLVLFPFLSSFLSASVLTIFDKQDFLHATNASDLSGALPNLGPVGSSIKLGGVTLRSENNQTLWLLDYVQELPGNELGINDFEHLNVFLDFPLRSFGFEFFEPNFGHNAPYVDSTFTVSLFNESIFVGSFSYNAPDGIQYFVGVVSTLDFDNVKIRETVGGIENEFYGRFYGGQGAETPEPCTIATLTLIIPMLCYGRRKKMSIRHFHG